MPVTYSYAFDETLAANLRQVVRREPREQAFEDSPTWKFLMQRPKTIESGYIHVNVSHVGTAVGGAYSDNDTMAITDVESGKVAQFEPAFYLEPARISRTDEKKYNTPRALFNLWTFKVNQAKMRLKKLLFTHLFTAKTGKNIHGLPDAIPVTNSTGTFGLNRATYDWWRNYSASTITFTSTGPDAMDLMSLSIQKSGKKPDGYVTTQAIFQKMKKLARTSSIRWEPVYTGRYKEMMLDLGIETISFEGSPVWWDPYCDSGKIYALRRDALYLGITEDFNVEGPFPLQGSGVQGKVINVYWGGQLLGEEQRALGQLSTVT